MPIDNNHARLLLEKTIIGIQENDINGVITYSNQAHHDLLGYAAGEIIGKTIFDLVHTPEQRAQLKEYLAYLIEEQPQPTPYIAVSYRKDGTPIETKIDWNYLRDDHGNVTGFISAISDFSAPKALQDKLQVERDLAHHYLDTAQFMVLILDAEGIITLVNHELCRVLDYQAEQLIGRNWFSSCVPEAQRNMIHGLFKDMIAGRAKFMPFFESEVLAANGDIHLISWRNSEQRDADGKVCGYICSGEDITERRKIEKEKLQLQDELRRMQKMEAFNRLTAGIAHDFNNILASVLGYADMSLEIAAEYSNAELQRYMTEVVNESEKARDLIKQLLTFSRSNPSHTPALPLLPLTKETVKALQESAGDEIELILNADEQIPDIEMSTQDFHQLLLSIITGGGETFNDAVAKWISINISTVTLEQEHCLACNSSFSGEYIEITISDDGSGIAPETLYELFNPLPSTKYTTATRGLLMAQSILHNHYGHITIDSIPGYGTTVRLLIPPAGLNSALGERPTKIEAAPANFHLMVVDDEASIAHLKGELLSSSDYSVDVFSDSITALEKCQQQPEKFDCALIKYSMPSLDGIELAYKLLALRPEMVIILFVPLGEKPEMPLPQSENIHVVNRPIAAENLAAIVHEIVGQHKRHP